MHLAKKMAKTTAIALIVLMASIAALTNVT